MIDVIPGIGPQKEWSIIEERLNIVMPHVEWAQIDFADNTFVPNTTFMEFEKFRDFSDKISLEAHLMVAQPEKYIKAAADAGFKRIIAHVEAHDPRIFLDQIDFVLVMTVESGFSGQPFLPETVEKIKSIHAYLPDLPIEVDGGISDVTARLVKDAGATRLVATSFLFKDPANITDAIEQLKNI